MQQRERSGGTRLVRVEGAFHAHRHRRKRGVMEDAIDPFDRAGDRLGVHEVTLEELDLIGSHGQVLILF